MHDFLFGKNKADYDTEYAKAIDSTKQAKADAEYNYHYNKALYDANKDYFDKMGVKDPTESYWNASGQKVNALTDSMSQYDKYLSQLSDERAKVAEKNKYNDFGDGFLPSLFGLNAWNQYLDTVGDFGKVLQQAGKNVMSGDYSVDPTAEWEKRDHLSDLGATIEAGISILPFVSAGAGSGASAANAATKTLGKSLLKGAGIGAAYGGAGSLGSYLQQNGKESNLGGALGSTALGASVGGAMGGAFGGLGYGVDKYANRAVQTRNIKDAYQQYLAQQGKGAMQDSARLLGDGVGGSSVVSPTKQPLEEWLMNRGSLAKTRLGQAVQGIGDTISINKAMGNNPLSRVSNSKVGNLTSRLLKTKTGKIGAGIGGGLLLSKLMNSGGSNSDQMSDADLQELYNYIYRGGQ